MGTARVERPMFQRPSRTRSAHACMPLVSMHACMIHRHAGAEGGDGRSGPAPGGGAAPAQPNKYLQIAEALALLALDPSPKVARMGRTTLRILQFELSLAPGASAVQQAVMQGAAQGARGHACTHGSICGPSWCLAALALCIVGCCCRGRLHPAIRACTYKGCCGATQRGAFPCTDVR